MSKKDKVVFQKREFLNEDPTLSAYVIANVEPFSHSTTKTQPSSWPTLDIADCSSKISLDFCFHNEKAMKEAQDKIAKLKAVIDGFAEAFDSEVKRFETAKAAIAKKKLERKKTNGKTAKRKSVSAS